MPGIDQPTNDLKGFCLFDRIIVQHHKILLLLQDGEVAFLLPGLNHAENKDGNQKQETPKWLTIKRYFSKKQEEDQNQKKQQQHP